MSEPTPPTPPSFPSVRLRRLRGSSSLRELVKETRLVPSDFILPLFVVDGEVCRTPIESLPGVYRMNVDAAVEEAAAANADGVRAVLLFGIPTEKDATGSESDQDDGIVQRALRAIRSAVPDLALITDVCLCAYTDHGHCGLVEGGDVSNDATLPRLASQAVSHARAGADIVAPSDMMDGRVGAIRTALDGSGYNGVAILSYAVKYASAFYGPFRDAAQSAPAFGDRRTYQMDVRNAREAIREVEQDVVEGADILMVKPALPSLDVLRRVKDRFGLPTVAYQVSGEHAALEAAGAVGAIDTEAARLETAYAIRRAGADLMVTYAARQLARQVAWG